MLNPVEKYSTIVKNHLYDEGPTNIEDIEILLGLSNFRAMEILTTMEQNGIVVQRILRAARKGRKQKDDWILSGDLA